MKHLAFLVIALLMLGSVMYYFLAIFERKESQSVLFSKVFSLSGDWQCIAKHGQGLEKEIEYITTKIYVSQGRIRLSSLIQFSEEVQKQFPEWSRSVEALFINSNQYTWKSGARNGSRAREPMSDYASVTFMCKTWDVDEQMFQLPNDIVFN